jgi:hypothetical protein
MTFELGKKELEENLRSMGSYFFEKMCDKEFDRIFEDAKNEICFSRFENEEKN